MMKKMFIFHPFLFSFFPILFLFAKNYDQVILSNITVPISIAASFVLVALILLFFALKDGAKAALLISCFLFLFFSYGQVRDTLMDIMDGALGLARHRNLLSLYAIVFVGMSYLIIRTRRNLHSITIYLNIVAAILVTIQLGIIVMSRFGLNDPKSLTNDTSSAHSITLNDKNIATPPNIYYIILDGYGRADILQELFQYDNQKFINYLEAKGFYVANKSASNYALTFLSLASSLNMKYLEDAARQAGYESRDRRVPHQMRQKNAVMQFLSQHGYHIIKFNSGWGGADGDIYVDENIPCGISNEFNEAFFQMTLLRPFRNWLPIDSYNREGILCIFEKLPQVGRNIEGPHFIFAHIITPHPPYFFDQNGNFKNIDNDARLGDRDLWKDKRGYMEQIAFVNTKMKALIDEIISSSKTPPVIIIQSDHGTASTDEWEHPSPRMLRERMSILNAYLLPNGGDTLLYPSITPVNTFRVIFDHYFKAGYTLLDDASYFSNMEHPYQFINVSNSAQ